jgi:4-alpha-glucanotransferase
MTFEQRKEYLKDAHRSASLFHVNPLQEYLALFPELIWQNPLDERINVPGTELPTNWKYRLKSDLGTIMDHKELSKEIMEIIRR